MIKIPLVHRGIVFPQGHKKDNAVLEFMPLREELAHYLNQDKIDLITQAFVFASAAHAHQTRISGQPYIGIRNSGWIKHIGK